MLDAGSMDGGARVKTNPWWMVGLLVACRSPEPEATATRTEDSPPEAPASPEAPAAPKTVAPTPVEPAPPPAEPAPPVEPPVLTWWCACYSERTDSGPQELMACRADKADCLDLERLARAGSPTVVADSLAMRCAKAHGDPPSNVGHARDWQQPAGPRTRDNRTGCLLPPDSPVSVLSPPEDPGPPPSPEPQPTKLESLAAEYRGRKPSAGDSEIRQAKRWHEVDYAAQILRATEGDEAALAVLMGLELDGAGAEIHAPNLETLLLGWGDEAFARVLAAQPKETIDLVIDHLDWSIQLTDPSDPHHYRQTHPKTFALGPAAITDEDIDAANPQLWCACAKPEGAADTTITCHQRVVSCAAVEQAALATRPPSLVKSCRWVMAKHPAEALGGAREAWRRLEGGGWEAHGECTVSGAPDVPTHVPSGQPQPRVLEALAALHAAGSDADPLPAQVRAWFRVDYRKLVAKAAAGDDTAVRRLAGLDVVGSVREIHGSVVESLMLGYGDERFAEILAKMPRKARERALRALDELEGGWFGTSAHYRHAYPRTFAAGRHVLP